MRPSLSCKGLGEVMEGSKFIPQCGTKRKNKRKENRDNNNNGVVIQTPKTDFYLPKKLPFLVANHTIISLVPEQDTHSRLILLFTNCALKAPNIPSVPKFECVSS